MRMYLLHCGGGFDGNTQIQTRCRADGHSSARRVRHHLHGSAAAAFPGVSAGAGVYGSVTGNEIVPIIAFEPVGDVPVVIVTVNCFPLDATLKVGDVPAPVPAEIVGNPEMP